jgi:tetratricopeptide (TPR) repeat protein
MQNKYLNIFLSTYSKRYRKWWLNWGSIIEEFELAEQYYRKSLKIFQEILGNKHFNTAVSYNNLASLYFNIGDFKKSKENYQIAKEILEKIFPNGILILIK